MAGYTRQDTANNIANGNVIDADDLDSEFNAIEGAFNSASGHTHDGSSGQGSPITKVGPSQDITVSTVAVLPKTTNTLDLGTSSVQFKNAYFDGTVSVDNITVDENITAIGSVTSTAGFVGDLTGNADTATAWETARTLTLSGDVTGTVSGIDGTGDIEVITTVGNDSHTHTSSFITDFIEATQDVVGGMVTGNTESGISVTYSDDLGKLNFDVNDPVITLSGDVAGSATMTNLGDVTITTTVQPNSVALGTDTTGNYVASLVAGTGVTLANNTGETATPTVSIGQAVATTSNVLFNQVTTTGNAVIGGNLTVSGTTTTVNTETINLADNIITLNSNETNAATQNAGIEVERGTDSNKTLLWDEANDRWTVGSESFVASSFIGNLTGNVTGNVVGNVTGTVSSVSNHTTDAIAEGVTNLYYTDVRADARIAAASITDLSDADQGVATTDSPTFVTLNATTVDLGAWTVTESAGVLYFAASGINVMKLDAAGNLTVAGNVTAYGTV